MRVRLSWKCPEWDYQLERQAAEANVHVDDLRDDLHRLGAGEYITVEFDTKENSATVVRKR